jgi:hypothetical protein
MPLIHWYAGTLRSSSSYIPIVLHTARHPVSTSFCISPFEMWDFTNLHFKTYRDWTLKSPAQQSRASPEQLRERKTRNVAAIAVWWDARRVGVCCPICRQVHHHGIDHFARTEAGLRIQDSHGRYSYNGPSATRSESRLAHCNHNVDIWVEYTILFPFEDDDRVNGLSFEIERYQSGRDQDVELLRYRTVGLDVGWDRSLDSPTGEGDTAEDKLSERLQGLQLDPGNYLVTTPISIPSLGIQDDITEPASHPFGRAALTGRVEEMKKLIEKSPHASAFINVRSEK